MWRVVLVCLAVVLAAPAAALAGSPTGRLLVSVRAPAEGAATAASPTAVAARSGAVIAGRGVPELGLAVVRPRAGETLRSLARRLRRDPAVRAVQAEQRAAPRLAPADPAFGLPDPFAGARGESLQWWAVRSNFPAAWDQADGDSVNVAIVDQGVDVGHPDLAPKIRATNDLDGTPSHRGADVDESGHGTHVASLACAQPGNDIGLAGAGFGCGLIVEKSDLSDSSVARAIVDAARRGAGVISMSIGTDDRAVAPVALVDAVAYAYARGAVLVAAASDKQTTQQGDPANILQPTGTGSDLSAGRGLTVTAADFTGGRARFAGDGSQISLAAYGAFTRGSMPNGLLGAFPQPTTELELGAGSRPCRCRTSLAGDDRYAFLEGTSMATPIVAGAAALVRDRNPDLGPGEVIRLLKQTAQRRPGTGWTNDLGWGIVDAGAAVAAAGRIDRRPPTSTVRAPATTRRRSVVLRLASHDTAAPGIRAAGVRSVRVYVARGAGRARLVATVGADAGALRVAVRPGGRYRFFTRALDRAGNLEALSRAPDARTRVARTAAVTPAR